MHRLWSIPRRVWAVCGFVQTQKYPQRRKLIVQWLLAVLLLREPRTAARVAELWGKHRSSYTRLLKRRLPVSSWIEAEAWAVLEQLGWQPGETVYVIYDTTYQMRRGKKIANLQKFWAPGPRQYIWAHALVGVILVYRGQRIPLGLAPYRTKSWCQKNGVKFRTQGELAADLLEGITWPAGLQPIVLCDSGLFGAPLLRVVLPRLKQGWSFVSVAQRSRKIEAGPGAGQTIKERIAVLVNTKRAFHQATCRSASGKQNRYWMRREEVTLRNVGEVALLYSGRQKKQAKQIKPLVTNRRDWSVIEVSEHYAQRWHIEVWFKEMKQELGLGDGRGQKLTAQKNHVQMAVLSYLLVLRLTVQAGEASYDFVKGFREKS